MSSSSTTLRTSLGALIGAATLAAAAQALAVPLPTVPPPAPLAPGLASRWVAVTPNPHSIGEAIDALAGAGGFTIVQTVNTVVPVVDLDDGCCGAASIDPLAALGYDSYAVRYTGYLQIAATGSYQFAMVHDDGIRVVLGGENIIEFPVDTGPTATLSSSFVLDPGFYALEITGWEQGGLFVNQFIVNRDQTGFEIVPASALFHVVPEPGTLALLGIALAGIGFGRRRPH